MDNFDWLEEDKKPSHKMLWLREYWLHIAALVIILVVLLFLLFNPASKSTSPETSTLLNTNSPEGNKQILIRMPDKTTKLANTTETNSPSNETNSPQTLTPEEPSLAPGKIPANAPNTSSQTVAPSRLPIKQIGVIGPKNSAAATNNTTAAATTTPPATPSKKLESTTPPTATTQNLAPTAPTTSSAPVTSAATPEVPTLTPAPVTSSSVTPKADTPATPPKTTPTPENLAIEKANEENAGLYKLLSRPENHYTLQLFGSNNEAAAKNFIAKNNLGDNGVYAKVWQNNQNWFIVLYGDYQNREQALAAVNQLPENLRAQSPWARSIQSIQDAIRQRLVRGN